MQYALCAKEGFETPHCNGVCGSCMTAPSPARPTIRALWAAEPPHWSELLSPAEKVLHTTALTLAGAAAGFVALGLILAALIGMAAYALGKIIEIWVVDQLSRFIDLAFGSGGATFASVYWGFWIALGVVAFLWLLAMSVTWFLPKRASLKRLFAHLAVTTLLVATVVGITTAMGIAIKAFLCGA